MIFFCYDFDLSMITEPTNIGTTKLMSQMSIPVSMMDDKSPENALKISTAYDPRMAGSEAAKEGV